MSINGNKRVLFPAAILFIALGRRLERLQFGVGSDEQIRVSGNIEAIEVPISFKVPGHVVKRFFDEGQSVKAGEPIAELEAADLRADVAAREGELAAAKAMLAEMLAGSRADEIRRRRGDHAQGRSQLPGADKRQPAGRDCRKRGHL